MSPKEGEVGSGGVGEMLTPLSTPLATGEDFDVPVAGLAPERSQGMLTIYALWW